MNIGFIGLGKMGYLIAANISKQYKTFVYNRTNNVGLAHSKEFNTVCVNDVKNIFKECHMVFMCLPTYNEVHIILTDDNLKDSHTKIIVDCTSSEPIFQKNMCEKLKRHNVKYFDAPVSGGPTKAQLGTLTAMVGGDEEIYPSVKTVMETFSNPIYVGSIGNGCAIKAVNNIMNVSHLCIAAEGLSTLESMGISKETALSVINNSSGRSLMTEERFPIHIMEKDYNYGFKLGLMKKDVGIALNMIQNPKMFSNIEGLISDSVDLYGVDADYTEVVKPYFNKDNGHMEKTEKDII